jgi:hypothetical protein
MMMDCERIWKRDVVAYEMHSPVVCLEYLKTPENMSQAGRFCEFRTGDMPNTNLQPYCYTNRPAGNLCPPLSSIR